MTEPLPNSPETELERKLGRLFRPEAIDPNFAGRLEERLLARAAELSRGREMPGRPAWLNRFSSASRALVWGGGAIILVLLLVWGIKNLLPTALVGAPPTPSGEPHLSCCTEMQSFVLFARSDDLWVQDLNREQPPERLTEGGILDWQMRSESGPYVQAAWYRPPRISPDGRWIAFSRSGSDLMLLDMSNHKLKELPEPGAPKVDWSPDSRRLAFVPDSGEDYREIYIYDLESGQSRALLRVDNGVNSGMLEDVVWSPDGQEIAYVIVNVQNQTFQLWKVQIETGETSQVAELANMDMSSPYLCWTADRQVTTDLARGVRCSPGLSIPRMMARSADGRYVAALTPNPDSGKNWNENAPSRLVVRRSDNGEVVWQRDFEMSFKAVAWSPDGQFLYLDDEARNSPIWRMTADGSGDPQVWLEDGFLLGVHALVVAPRPVTTSTPQVVENAPLGKVAYLQEGALWIKALPDGQPRRLLEAGEAEISNPKWSPSGDWLAFLHGNQVQFIYKDGNRLHTAGDEPVRYFAWHPGKDILLMVTDSGKLLLQTAEGTLLTQLFPGPGDPQPGARLVGWPAWSPDGEQIAFNVEVGSPHRSYAGIWTVIPSQDAVPVERYAPPSPPQDGLSLAGWTSNGQGLLYWQVLSFAADTVDGLPLWYLPLDGANKGQPIEVGASLLYQDFHDFSPSGSNLALTQGGGRESWRNKQIVVYQMETLRHWTVSDPSQAAVSPAFSPDGTRLAYAAGPDLGDQGRMGDPPLLKRHLWLAQVDGTGAQQLTAEPGYADEHPQWSQDGQALLFSRRDAQGRASLWLLSPVEKGAQPQPVVGRIDLDATIPEYFGHVDWEKRYDWWQPQVPAPENPATTQVPQPSETLRATASPPSTPTPFYFPPTPTPNLTPPPPTPAPTPDLARMDVQVLLSDSPDGQWTAEALYASPDNSEEWVTDKDYMRLTVTRKDGSQQWVFDEQRERGLGAAYPSHLSWSPDGGYLYIYESGAADGCGTPFDRDLRKIDLTNGAVSPIPLKFSGNMTTMSISPSGATLAYLSGSQVVFRSLSDEREQPVAFEMPQAEDLSVSRPVWSPDEQAVLLTIQIDTCTYSAKQASTSIVRIDLNTHSATTLVREDTRQLYVFDWPQPEKALANDKGGDRLWLDVRSGDTAPAPSDDLGAAIDTLLGYFQRLHDGDYEGAAGLYGGSYEVLVDNNPSLDPQDHAALFKNACEINGFQCLKVRRIVEEEKVSADEFRFLVEFMNPDGSLFVRGPCCGATEAETPSVWQFAYTVKRLDATWRVMELPVYVP